MLKLPPDIYAGGIFVVPRIGEVYDAQVRGPVLEF
jgi:hypothetical protein